MKIMESVKKGFSVTTGSFGLVLGLFVFGFLWNVLNLTLIPRETPPDAQPPMTLVALGVAVLLFSFYIQAGSLGFLLNKVKTAAATREMFFNSALKYFIRLLGLGVFIGLLGLLFIMIAALVTASLKTIGVIVAVALAATWIYIVLLLFLTPYVIVAKDQKLIASAKESIGLAQKNIWSIIGLAVLLILIGFVIGILLGLVLGGISLAVKGQASEYIFAAFSSFVNAFLGVLVTASFMSYYLGLSSEQS